MITYYNLLDTIKTQLLQDPYCNSVTEGSIWEIDLAKQTIMPYSHIQVNNTTITDNTYIFNVSVFCMDIVDKSKDATTDEFKGNDNEQDVLNTQFAVASRLLELMRRGTLRDNNFALADGSQPTLEAFTERFENYFAGWVATFDVEVINEMTICGTISPSVCESSSYDITNSAGTTLYSGTIVSGGSLTQAITNATVSNSDDSYTASVLAQGTLALSDVEITVRNSAGATVGTHSLPAAVNGTATAPDGTVRNTDGSYSLAVVSGTTDGVITDSTMNFNGASAGTFVSAKTTAVTLKDETGANLTPTSKSLASNTLALVVQNPVTVFTDMYKGKAVSHGGAFESPSCIDTSDIFTTAPWGKIQPTAYGTGKLIAMKPFDGGFDLDVVRNTTAYRTNSSNLLESVAANVPRLDYDGVTCPSVLVETQSTNLLLYSQEFDNAWWKKNSSTVTANDAVAPDGTTTAEKLALGGVNSARVFRNSTVTTSNTHVLSVWMKGTAGEKVSIEAGSGGNSVTLTADWVRYSVVNTGGETSTNCRIINRAADGDDANDVYIWGIQLEEASTPSSYIVTGAAQATRNADVLSVTGLSGTSTVTETFEDDSTNVISNPSTYTMSTGRIKKVTRTV
ncbi:MAG: hypothetical protein Unbinned3907contig1000_48 [Prokaryotic dsDNA virus sp.]|nr:MAG: hypothetical protein Unbinned3907contig1000_48 [Prokaryotic dsDNA virus sp.]|tara:strand:- start:15001 stop:16872 length:1872 start_codon:yes stop_codon:yes gene_type:complete